MNALSIEVKKVISIPCKSFESKLLFESRLSPDSVGYAILGKVLFDHLTFDDRYAIGKLYAVVAGSYPAFLGKTVKTYGNVNVFIFANDRNLNQYLLHSLSCDICTQRDKYEDICTQDVYEQHRVNGGIITVANFGKIQFIVKQHYTCLCDFHLNTRFFKDFHHCTRWRLYVFKNLFLVRYMHFEGGCDRTIICRKTAISLKRTRDWRGGKLGNEIISKLYPNKHLNNVLDFGPPTLLQQAMDVILKNKNLIDMK